jgi:hypothetical protein
VKEAAMHNTGRTLLLSTAILSAGAALLALDLPNLSGHWQLNQDASDDPSKVLQNSHSDSSGGGGGGGMGGGGGRGGHGRGGGGGRGGSRSSGGDAAGGRADFFEAVTSLNIEHHEPQVTITDAAGRERTIYTDGRKTEEEHSHGGTTAVTASWKDGHLEVVSKPETGGKITETYAVAADGSQLTVTTKVEGGHNGSFTIRRVYDVAKPGAPKPPPSPQAPLPTEDPGEDQSV